MFHPIHIVIIFVGLVVMVTSLSVYIGGEGWRWLPLHYNLFCLLPMFDMEYISNVWIATLECGRVQISPNPSNHSCAAARQTDFCLHLVCIQNFCYGWGDCWNLPQRLIWLIRNWSPESRQQSSNFPLSKLERFH